MRYILKKNYAIGKDFNAIEAIYKILNQEIKKIDITEVMKKLQDHVGKFINIKKITIKKKL